MWVTWIDHVMVNRLYEVLPYGGKWGVRRYCGLDDAMSDTRLPRTLNRLPTAQSRRPTTIWRLCHSFCSTSLLYVTVLRTVFSVYGISWLPHVDSKLTKADRLCLSGQLRHCT